jgi:hypothetical protein
MRGGQIPRIMQTPGWRPKRVAGPDMSLNAGLLYCTTITSPSSPTLLHTSSTQGTQAPPTTSSGLQLGLNVESDSSTRAEQVTDELLGRGAKRPSVNSPTQPRGGFHNKAAQLHLNAP